MWQAQAENSVFCVTKSNFLTLSCQKLIRRESFTLFIHYLLMQRQDLALLLCRKKSESDIGSIDGERGGVSGCAIGVHVGCTKVFSAIYFTLHLHQKICSPGEAGTLLFALSARLRLHSYYLEMPQACSLMGGYLLLYNHMMYGSVCLLGAHEAERYTPGIYIAVTRLFYLARMLIAHFWLSPSPPSCTQWIEQINHILIREKNTYQHRCSPKKF